MDMMLLDRVLQAHGGRERWNSYKDFTAHASISGSLIPSLPSSHQTPDHAVGNGQSSDRRRLRALPCELAIEGEAQRPFLRIFGATDATLYGAYTPERCEVRNLADELQAGCDMPFLKPFPTECTLSPVDVISVLGAILWNTIVGPFVVTLGGDVAERQGQLDITLPEQIDPISPRRTWAIDDAALICRADYDLKIVRGLRVVETMSAYGDFDGIRIPTLRRIVLGSSAGHAATPLIDVEIFDLRFQ
jgi:hypothetical protein